MDGFNGMTIGVIFFLMLERDRQTDAAVKILATEGLSESTCDILCIQKSAIINTLHA